MGIIWCMRAPNRSMRRPSVILVYRPYFFLGHRAQGDELLGRDFAARHARHHRVAPSGLTKLDRLPNYVQ
jgi:hypothetical protein